MRNPTIYTGEFTHIIEWDSANYTIIYSQSRIGCSSVWHGVYDTRTSKSLTNSQGTRSLTLLIMYTVARNTTQDLPDALLDHSLEFILALDEQAAGEAHRVDAQLFARLGERVRLLFARDDVYVIERQDDVVRDRRLCGRAIGHCWRVPAEGG